MKIGGGVMTELLNMWMMCFNDNEDDVVKDFIAFGIIASIDDIMVAVIKSLDVEQAVEGQTFNYRVYELRDLAEHYKQDLGKKFIYIMIYKLFNLLYVGIYFYFFPLFMLILVFVYGDGKIDTSEEE